MDRKQFIAAIKKVSPEAAGKMSQYLKSKDPRFDLTQIPASKSAHKILDSLMRWDATDERHGYWDKIYQDLADIEKDSKPKKTAHAKGCECKRCAPTVLVFDAPIKDDIKVLQKFLKTEGYKTKATACASEHGTDAITLTIFKKE